MENRNEVLSVGDRVLWRGGFGKAPARIATVERIALVNSTCEEVAQAGSVAWGLMDTRLIVVDVDCSGVKKWAYGFQVKPLTEVRLPGYGEPCEGRR